MSTPVVEVDAKLIATVNSSTGAGSNVESDMEFCVSSNSAHSIGGNLYVMVIAPAAALAGPHFYVCYKSTDSGVTWATYGTALALVEGPPKQYGGGFAQVVVGTKIYVGWSTSPSFALSSKVWTAAFDTTPGTWSAIVEGDTSATFVGVEGPYQIFLRADGTLAFMVCKRTGVTGVYMFVYNPTSGAFTTLVGPLGATLTGNGNYESAVTNTDTNAFPYGWQRTCPIVIQQSRVAANQTAFPVLITNACLPNEMLTTGDPNAAQANGGDIRFSTDINGINQLPCEIVGFTQNANPALATAEIWVPVSVLSATNVTIYVWYKPASVKTQPGASTQFGSQAVWDANYMGVWHLPNGTVLSANDSTSNGRNLTISGAWGAAAGVVDGGTAAGNGTTQYLSHATVTTPASISFSAWNFVAVGDARGDALMYWGPALAAAPRLLLHCPFTDNNMYFDYNTAFGGRISAAFTYGAYNYITVTYDTVTHVQNLLVNGVVVATQTSAFANPALTALYINKLDGAFGKRKVDEPRLSNIARSVNWTLTEYRNQSSPSTFAIAGAPAAAAVITNPTAIDVFFYTNDGTYTDTFWHGRFGADNTVTAPVQIVYVGQIINWNVFGLEFGYTDGTDFYLACGLKTGAFPAVYGRPAILYGHDGAWTMGALLDTGFDPTYSMLHCALFSLNGKLIYYYRAINGLGSDYIDRIGYANVGQQNVPGAWTWQTFYDLQNPVPAVAGQTAPYEGAFVPQQGAITGFQVTGDIIRVVMTLKGADGKFFAALGGIITVSSTVVADPTLFIDATKLPVVPLPSMPFVDTTGKIRENLCGCFPPRLRG